MFQTTLINNLSVIRDFRQLGKVQHEFIDDLFLAITAVILGCKGWDEIEN